MMWQKHLRERITTLSFVSLVENDQRHLNEFLTKLETEVKPELLDIMVRKYQPFLSKKLNKAISEDETKAILKQFLQLSSLDLFNDSYEF